MADGDFRIAGTKVKTPTMPTIGMMEITDRERTASGKMVGDIIADKIRIEPEWQHIDDSELVQILNLIKASRPYFTVEFPGAGGQKVMTAYNGDITYSLYGYVNGKKRWESVTIPFIEQ